MTDRDADDRALATDGREPTALLPLGRGQQEGRIRDAPHRRPHAQGLRGIVADLVAGEDQAEETLEVEPGEEPIPELGERPQISRVFHHGLAHHLPENHVEPIADQPIVERVRSQRVGKPDPPDVDDHIGPLDRQNGRPEILAARQQPSEPSQRTPDDALRPDSRHGEQLNAVALSKTPLGVPILRFAHQRERRARKDLGQDLPHAEEHRRPAEVQGQRRADQQDMLTHGTGPFPVNICAPGPPDAV